MPSSHPARDVRAGIDRADPPGSDVVFLAFLYFVRTVEALRVV
jgi:hypothetical protein